MSGENGFKVAVALQACCALVASACSQKGLGTDALRTASASPVSKSEVEHAENVATLRAADVDTLPRWTSTLQRRLLIAARPRPELAVVDVAVEPQPYDSGKHQYPLRAVGVGSDSFDGFAYGFEYPGTVEARRSDWFGLVFRPGGIAPDDCSGDDPAALVITHAALSTPGYGGTHLSFFLEKNETDAQAINPRLQHDKELLAAAPTKGETKDISTLLRLQIVFHPGPYGEAPRTCVQYSCQEDVAGEEVDLRAFLGTGVGYRLLDAQGVLIDWTAFGSEHS